MELLEFSLNNCKTIDMWINEGKSLYVAQRRYSFLAKLPEEGVIVSIDNLIARHIDALKGEITEITFSDEDYIKYKYQPKLVSYDLYNTTELWSAIMYINNITSITQFNRKKIKVFGTSFLDALEELLVINDSDLTNNRYGID